MNNYKRVLFLVSFLALLASPAFSQQDNGGVGTGGGSSVPHAGIGACPAGQAAIRLVQNAPPLCAPFGSGAGSISTLNSGNTSITVTNPAGPTTTITLVLPGGTCGTHQFGISLDSVGTFGCQQPNIVDLSGLSIDTFVQGTAGVPQAGVLPSCSAGQNALTYSTSSHTFGCNTLAAGGVTSVTGTANQVLASPTTGAVILSLIGPYTPATYTAHALLLGEGTSSISTLLLGADTFAQGVASADPQAGTLPNCSNDGSHALIYSTSTHNFTCQAITTGTVTGGTNSCSAGFVQTGTTISSTGVPTAVCTQKTDKFSCPLPAAATNNAILCDIPMPIAETVPINCSASVGTSVVAANASTTFTIKKITSGGSSTTIGTAVWSASGKTAAFTCASSVALAATDLLEIDGPATGDTTLTQGGITISANAGTL